MKKFLTFLLLSLFVLATASAAVFINADDIAEGSIKSVTKVEGGIINAASDRAVDVERRSGGKAADDGEIFTSRIKLNGSGSADARSITFDADKGDVVDIYLNSSSSSADRTLVMEDSAGNVLTTFIAPSDAGNAGKVSYTIPETGSYTVYSKSSGINVYRIVSQGLLKTGTGITPQITNIEGKGNNIFVTVNVHTGLDGLSSVAVRLDNQKKPLGRALSDERVVTFDVDGSGTYTVSVDGGNTVVYDYVVPLDAPSLTVKNEGNGVMRITVGRSGEAEKYMLFIKGGNENSAQTVEPGDTVVTLQDGVSYEFKVVVSRGSELATSEIVKKKCSVEADREWNFAWFGQSTNKDLNRMEMIDSENLTFKLYSCSFDEKTDDISRKGGKFTSFHDGVSYYYTEYDPKTENWELTATFTVDYINPTADGQEGFGLLAMDHIGENMVNSVNHYTNSAGIIATKFEETIGGTKKTGKDTLGARFVTGITPEVLAMGDSGIAMYGLSEGHAYSYDDIVKKGDVYTITLKKDNTGYRAIYKRTIASEDTIEEYILYGPDKLEQIDPDRSYVGFAVARGCNVTVSNVSFVVTDPATDPPAEKEPPVLIPLTYKVDSPTTASEKNYHFVFNANADGELKLATTTGYVLFEGAPVKANVDFTADLELIGAMADVIVTFTPDINYSPGENMRMAQYDRDLKIYKENYSPVSISHTVLFREFEGDEIHVSTKGDPFGDGSEKKPLDLLTAISYVKPGQTIVMDPGTYYMERSLIIERGNSGRKGEPKKITCKDGRAVLDFSGASGGMQIWGDWWEIENIDITRTPDEIKGMQIAGSNNIIRGVNAYRNGDTGIQISGMSAETFEKWPSNNLVISCVSHDNADSAANNADGFTAKLTVADGNKFKYCISYNNIDDGWDLYAKIESGPIGAVVIEDCVAYRNGVLSDGSVKGDGNGFKLGGDGIFVPHTLKHSVSFGNLTDGVTCNSNPALNLIDVVSYCNEDSNIALYSKNDNAAFTAHNVKSVKGIGSDELEGKEAYFDETTYFFTGSVSMNSKGEILDVNPNPNIVPEFEADGSIDIDAFLKKVGF